MMLNTELKILTKILVSCFQAVLSSLIGSEQTCTVKGRTNLHLLCLIIKQLDWRHIDWFRSVQGIWYSWPSFSRGCSKSCWIQAVLLHLDLTSGVLVGVNGVCLEPFVLSHSICQGCLLAPLLYVLALEPFLHKLKTNLVLCRISLSSAPPMLMTFQFFCWADPRLTKLAKRSEGTRWWQRTKINHNKSVGLQLSTWKTFSIPRTLSGWTSHSTYCWKWIGQMCERRSNSQFICGLGGIFP